MRAIYCWAVVVTSFILVLAIAVFITMGRAKGPIPSAEGIVTGVMFHTGHGVVCVEEAAADGFHDAFPQYTRGDERCLIDGRTP